MVDGVTLTELVGPELAGGVGGELRLTGLCLDSRLVRAGDAFVALRGARSDGREHAAQAVANGAVAVLAETPAPRTWADRAPWIEVPRLAQRLEQLAATCYGHPDRQLRTVAVTGTNGKSSCVHFLAQAAPHCLRTPSAVISTLGSGPLDDLQPSGHTTPDLLTLYRSLRDQAQRGIRLVAMETSSHALHQGRTGGLSFDVAAFTNISHDHLDYHPSFEEYFRAKASLFTHHRVGCAVINVDDEHGARLAMQLESRMPVLRTGVGRRTQADIRGRVIACETNGMRLGLDTPWGRGEVMTPLMGRFNVDNLLVVTAALAALGAPFREILAALAELAPVPGRMQRITADGARPTVVVDYAHSPDALRQALRAVREHTTGRVWCVFGCGGERDRDKRPIMGAIAEADADRVVVTSDNPRGEPPMQIIREIRDGMRQAGVAVVEADRAAAIRLAIASAEPGDTVLIAGKGHEDYQLVGDERRPFDDARYALQALEAVA